MSRVTIETIGEIIYSYSYPKVKDIEVVPRKMVEMIIAECEQTLNSPTTNWSRKDEAGFIKTFAESLLKKFEEDKE